MTTHPKPAPATPAGLHLSDELYLPIEAVTETFAILAKRGRGKTSTAVVMTEEMIRAGHPVVVLDPVGVWWGLRSAADGINDGLPVVILGGDHGDLPLRPEAGALVAETLVASRAPAVIDLSSLSKTQARRFATDFIETLYHRNRDPLHVVVDEADSFAPQRAQADGARLLGAMEDLVRRGRARGLGTTLITQRPAVLNKDVLTQAEVLIALGMTGPRDVAAIDEWVRLHADEDQAKEVKASLPSLPVGTAWVWSPGWLEILRKVQIRPRDTFDSSATPKPGQARATARHMTPIDVAALGAQMEALVQQARDNDPRALRARVQQLERDLANASTEPVEIRVDVPTLPAGFAAALADVAQAVHQLQQVANTAARAATPSAMTAPRAPSPQPARAHANAPRPQTPAPATTRDGEPLGRAQRSILNVLATYGPRPKTSVAILAGYSAKGGGFNNALSAMRTAGLIERGEPITITPAGAAALGPVDPLPAGPALREHWKAQSALGKAPGLILDALAAAYPAALTVEDVAQATGYAAAGGGFNNAVSRLRSLGLIRGGRDGLTIDEDLV